MTENTPIKYNLTVDTGDEGAEIFIIDSQFHRAASGVGNQIVFNLPGGLYTIKVTAGSSFVEKSIALFRDEVAVFNPISFSSPAPLEQTKETPLFHTSNAVLHSKDIHVSIGKGSQIFVFARIWTENSQTEKNNLLQEDPATGLSLRNAENEVLVDFGEPEVGIYAGGTDPWSACNVELDPGVYCLCLQTKKQKVFIQTIVVSPKWQTQVFLLQREYDQFGDNSDSETSVDLSNASIFMAEIGKGFQSSKELFSDESNFRLTEMARQALIKKRPVVRPQLIHEMLEDKFKNPMLGIYGCHLVLLNKNSEEVFILPQVIAKLRVLLTDPHPEVEALAVKLNMPTDYIFTMPPMLFQSWNYILEASVTRPGLIPENSLTEKIAGRLWSGDQWLLWDSLDLTSPNSETLETQLQGLVQFDTKRFTSFTTGVVSDETESSAMFQNLDFNEEKMKFMVQALGVPRSKLEAALQTVRSKSTKP